VGGGKETTTTATSRKILGNGKGPTDRNKLSNLTRLTNQKKTEQNRTNNAFTHVKPEEKKISRHTRQQKEEAVIFPN